MTSRLKQTNKEDSGIQSPHQCSMIAIKHVKEESLTSATNIFLRNFRHTLFFQVISKTFWFIFTISLITAERYAQYVRMNPQGTEEAVQDEVGANPSNEETIVIEPFLNADKNQNATTGPSQDNAYNAQVQYRRLKPPADDVIDWVFLFFLFYQTILNI
jgi:hypothetical protein